MKLGRIPLLSFADSDFGRAITTAGVNILFTSSFGQGQLLLRLSISLNIELKNLKIKRKSSSPKSSQYSLRLAFDLTLLLVPGRVFPLSST